MLRAMRVFKAADVKKGCGIRTSVITEFASCVALAFEWGAGSGVGPWLCTVTFVNGCTAAQNAAIQP